MKLLHIDSSITGANSASRQLSAALVAALKAAIPGLEVIRRDLDADPIPHLDSKRLPTVRPANAPEGAVGIADEGGSDALDEFLSVDILVIGVPMYNFGTSRRPALCSGGGSSRQSKLCQTDPSPLQLRHTRNHRRHVRVAVAA